MRFLPDLWELIISVAFKTPSCNTNTCSAFLVVLCPSKSVIRSDVRQ